MALTWRQQRSGYLTLTWRRRIGGGDPDRERTKPD
jgi:hypothetical protein